jgi:hypothetical protein
MQTSSQHTSPQDTAGLDWALVLGLLPDGWAAQAGKCGAFRRARKVKTPEALLRLVLMHAGVGLSFQQTADAARHGELAQMAKASVWERVQRVGPWLDWLIATMLRRRVTAPKIAGYRARAVDATVVSGPKSKTQLRLHYALCLASLSCDDMVIGDAREAEGFHKFRVAPGDLLIGDRVYAKAKGIAAVKQAGGDVIVRLGRTSLTLYDEAGAKIDWLSWLRGTASGKPRQRFAQFRNEGGQWTAGRLCAVRLSDEQVEKAQRRCRKTAQRKGTKLRDTTLEAASYLCVFTTTPQERLSARMVLEFYRTRWQIELCFKRLKSLLGADQLREVCPAAARIWLQGKMLYALLLQACLQAAGSLSPRERG